MQTGYVNAVAALLVASGWVAAQAPQPISNINTKAPAPAAPAPASPGTSNPAKRASYEPQPEVIPVAPVPAGAFPPAGPQPATQVLPYGAYVDAPAGRQYTVWGNADFLAWRINNGRVPAVTAQPPVGVLTVQTVDFINTVNSDGSLSSTVQPGVVGFFPLRIQDVPALPNSDNVNLGESLGARFNLGAWFTSDQLIGIEGTYFFLEPRGQLLANGINNANNQFLYTTPFSDREFTVTPGQGDAPPTRSQTGTFPIFFVRQLDSTLTAGLSNSMWGGEVNLRSTCCYFGATTIGGLVGFRHLQFTEELDMNGTFDLTTPASVPRATDAFGNVRPDNLPDRVLIATRDNVSAKNRFYGGNIGLDFDTQVGGCFLNLRTKVAMGGMQQRVDVAGFSSTVTTATSLLPANSTTTAGGLLFNQLDNGKHSRQRISFIPELNLKAGYQVCSWLRGYVGYDVMFISNMIRPGDVSAPLATASTLQNSTDPRVGAAPAAGAGTTNLTVTQPSFRFNDSNVWTQGFNFGIELSY